MKRVGSDFVRAVSSLISMVVWIEGGRHFDAVVLLLILAQVLVARLCTHFIGVGLWFGTFMSIYLRVCEKKCSFVLSPIWKFVLAPIRLRDFVLPARFEFNRPRENPFLSLCRFG